jgi:hypothetical protein
MLENVLLLGIRQIKTCALVRNLNAQRTVNLFRA